MHYFGEKIINLLNFKCWLHYVDDTFIFVENPFDTSAILEISNNIDPHIHFTFKLENHGQFPFLNVLVTRCDSFYKTCVYRNLFSVSNSPYALANYPPN